MVVKLIFVIFFVGFFVIFLGLIFFFRIIRSIFGGPDPKKTRQKTTSNKTGFHTKGADDSTQSPRRKKLFDHTDGEYVDYEDIKEKKE